MHERLPSYNIVAHAQDEPVFLYGPPSRLQGFVRLDNQGEEVVVLRQGRLVIDEGEIGGGAVSLSRLRTVRLLPGMSAR